MRNIRRDTCGADAGRGRDLGRVRRIRSLPCVLGALAVMAPGPLAAQTAEIRFIPALYDAAGPLGGTQAVALSGNGQVVVGHAWPRGFGLAPPGTLPEVQAFRWSAAGGMQGLGFFGASAPQQTYANAVSWDGSVVVGRGVIAFAPGVEETRAFRWTASRGLQVIVGGGPDSASSANGVSADGAIVVGSISAPRFGTEAFRWTEAGGVERLGFLPGASSSGAAAISGDGGTIVGSSGLQAFRWTASGRMASLGSPDDPAWRSARASAVSFDGAVIAGDWSDAGSVATQGFVWTAGSGMRPIGFLPVVAPPEWRDFASPALAFSTVRAISADGALVVGSSGLVQRRDAPAGNERIAEAFRWSAAAGLQSIPALLRAAGVDLGANRLDVATGITTTGPGGTNIILGYSGEMGSAASSWIVRLPDPRGGTGGAGFTTPEALLASLDQVPSGAATAERIVRSAQREALVLAEHYGDTLSAEHPIAGFVQLRGGGWDPPDEWGTAFGGAAGVIMRIGAAARAGFAVSATGQDSEGNGSDLRTRIDAAGARLFALVGERAAGPRLAAAFGYDQLWADIRRRYPDSASSEATGSGRTDGQALTASLRGAWGFPMGQGTTLSPFVAWHAVSTRLAAYEEGPGSGPFPARFDTQRQTGTAAGIGLEAEHAFAGGHRLWGNLAYNARLSGDTSSVSGRFADLFAFDLRGLPVAQRRWVEGSLGGAVALSPRSRLVGTLGAALPTEGGRQYGVFSSLGLVVGF